ncbi:MAG: aconitase X catalytic domain-containing protein [Candidatus Altiarchaeota archaeon]|nr:aconitase X catalytic domain-containing protein [Candidatus Altiarchaeota archaeon]
MQLSRDEEDILDGKAGNAAAKSMKILAALGEIYGAKRLIPVTSVQVAGVSYENLGDAGLEYLAELAVDGRVKVLTTLNPAGMDLKDWRKLGIPDEFAVKQKKVIDAFSRMGIVTSCTCTPYLAGNLPAFGEHVAWGESSAVTFVNSVIGARTNREGGPSALAAAIIGKTPEYGLHLSENRKPDVHVRVDAKITGLSDYGALGYVIGKSAEGRIPYITGLGVIDVDSLKSFSASVVTFGAKPLFHIENVTPEARAFKQPLQTIVIRQKELDDAYKALNDEGDVVDFVSLGCPHCSIKEIAEIADHLEGKKVNPKVELWVATSRPIKVLSDERGYTKVIEDAGGKFACDTCMVVAPIKGRFKSIATTSAKACYYSRGRNAMKTKIGPMEKCIDAAVTGKWS